LHVSQLLSEAARGSRHTPEALRVVGEYATEFAYLVASLDKESRRKIWSLARRLLRNKKGMLRESDVKNGPPYSFVTENPQ
jgi:hypothetical protein